MFWALFSFLHPSAISNIVQVWSGLKLPCEVVSVVHRINHVSTMIRAMYCLMWTLFITKHVSCMIRLIVFWWKKEGNWYIYPYFLAHKILNNVHKNLQNHCKIFKLRLQNVLSTGTNIVIVWLSLHIMGSVKFARHCGKMYNCHFFSYSGLGYHVNNFNKRVYIVAFCCVADKICSWTALKVLVNKYMSDPFCCH